LYFLIPREVSADTATLWTASVDEALDTQQLQLSADTPGTVTYEPWLRWPLTGENPRVRHREVRVAGLPSRQTFSFTLELAGTVVATAQITTLPQMMPLLGEKAFIVLLGSCFAYHEDAEGKVGNAFFHLPHPARPDVKFFAGDQVYLDSPWQRYATGTHSAGELQSIFLEHYVNTWTQTVGTTAGFSRLLAEGANFFSSDDHEYWNNAPNFAAFALDTWTEGGRKAWFKTARELYSAFQTPRFVTQFAVPPVSFLIADTRVNRDADQKNFMKASDLEAVRQWVGALEGPGVLVVGQPILQGKTSFLGGTFGDWNLPDYEQYSRLAAIIGSSAHSLVVLTGDVHFGRVAHTSLRSGAELIEIISSPMSLVDEAAKGKWEKAPTIFPAIPPLGSSFSLLARSGVDTVPKSDFAPTDGHFLTVEFTRLGPGAHLRLRFWPVFSNAVPPSDFGKIVWERDLA
jgi:hypothetical protein